VNLTLQQHQMQQRMNPLEALVATPLCVNRWMLWLLTPLLLLSLFIPYFLLFLTDKFVS
jgi:hypothetical protein